MNGFEDIHGNMIYEGQKVKSLDTGKVGILVRCYHDGSCFVNWTEGKMNSVNWNRLIKP